MCTYLTEKIEVAGSGKGAAGWFSLTDATVYLEALRAGRGGADRGVGPGAGPGHRGDSPGRAARPGLSLARTPGT